MAEGCMVSCLISAIGYRYKQLTSLKEWNLKLKQERKGCRSDRCWNNVERGMRAVGIQTDDVALAIFNGV